MVRYPLTLMDAWHTMHSVGYPWNYGYLAGKDGRMPAISCSTLNIRLLSLDFQGCLCFRSFGVGMWKLWPSLIV
jgi:hypothetical protein